MQRYMNTDLVLLAPQQQCEASPALVSSLEKLSIGFQVKPVNDNSTGVVVSALLQEQLNWQQPVVSWAPFNADPPHCLQVQLDQVVQGYNRLPVQLSKTMSISK